MKFKKMFEILNSYTNLNLTPMSYTQTTIAGLK